MESHYEKLLPYFLKMRKLGHLISLLNYDLETACPKKAIEEEGDLLGEVFAEYAKISQDPEYIALLKEAAKEDLTPMRRRSIESELKQVEFMEKISIEEFSAYQKMKLESNAAWKVARENNDFPYFLKYWDKLIKEQRRILSLKRKPEHKTLYDVALDDYEPGSNQEKIDELFNPLKEFLIKKIPETLKRQEKIKYLPLKPYSVDAQRKLSYKLLDLIRYDMGKGYLGVSAHPFSDFASENDTRVTTRFDVDDWRSNASTCLHEGGHCIQAQNWSREMFDNYASGLATSAQCETHSRFYENIVGRSMAFMPHLKKACAETLDPEFVTYSDEDFYNLMNQVKPIENRCNSDELTYCLHIIIRYEIERDLINGVIECKDVPEIWNRKYKEYLGVEVTSDSEGCLQDTHWSDGSIGYFPSYALGNIYGAQILNTMRKDLDFEAVIASGDLDPIRKWLAEKDFAYDWMKPNDWIEKVTGSKIDIHYYTEYLDQKY